MNHEGIGLGLTICKSIVEKSGGSIHVESEGPGKGSCFIFSLKMSAVAAVPAIIEETTQTQRAQIDTNRLDIEPERKKQLDQRLQGILSQTPNQSK